MHHYASTATDDVVKSIRRRGNASIGIENIQDLVELNLIRTEHFDVARAYIVFRSRQAERRPAQTDHVQSIQVSDASGAIHTVSLEDLMGRLAPHATGLAVDLSATARQAVRDLYKGLRPAPRTWSSWSAAPCAVC